MKNNLNIKELIWRCISTGVSLFLTNIIIEKFFNNNYWIGLVIICIICTVFEILKYFVKGIIDHI